jgi:hypothetical protein
MRHARHDLELHLTAHPLHRITVHLNHRPITCADDGVKTDESEDAGADAPKITSVRSPFNAK